MTLVDRIESAFAHRKRPTAIAAASSPVTSEDEDALWFVGRDWRDVTLEDWRKYSDAYFRFTPDAFRYFLPSILRESAKDSGCSFLAADYLVNELDRSPDVNLWNASFLKRFFGLEPEEYSSLREWLLHMSASGSDFREDALTRAYETVELLHRETEKVRRLKP